MSPGAIAIVVTLVTAGVFALIGFFHASRHAMNLEEFVVSRNRFGGWMAFSTIVASAMGAWILFSPPEVGATTGIVGILGYCIGQAAPSGIFSGIGPRIRNLMPNGHSLNEYVLYRFGQAMYLLTLTIVVFYMFVYLVAELTAIAKAVQIVADVPLGWTALVVITATFIYTTYGGLSTTIFTDAIQFAIVVPLLLISFGVVVIALGSWGSAIAPVQMNAPELFSLGNIPGIKFGATLVIAVIVAEICNQGNWQRIYACRSNDTVKRAFLGSALAIVPLLFLAGLLGILGMHFGFNDDRTFFSLIQQLSLPFGFIILILVLALALVMSSMDTLLNGIASVFALDLTRIFPQMQSPNLLRISRAITITFGVPAILIAAQGYNVLYLFLVADLVCAGIVVPIIVGLYSRRLIGMAAFWSAVFGIGAGALFFPKPDYTPWLAIPFGGDLLVSFIVPVVVSGLVVAIAIWLNTRNVKSDVFDFNQLQGKIHTYVGGEVVSDEW
jgi:Na+/proline symporter